jgi:hypothetical protein
LSSRISAPTPSASRWQRRRQLSSAGELQRRLGPQSIAVGDFNKDGTDLAVANYGMEMAILLGSARRVFGRGLYDAGASSDAAGDLNGDGKLDVVTANFDGSDVSVLIGVGDGTFQAPVHYSGKYVGRPSGPNCIVLADLNGDGKPTCCRNTQQPGCRSVGQRDGTFQAGIDYRSAPTQHRVAGDSMPMAC